jgi:hypothetical protein
MARVLVLLVNLSLLWSCHDVRDETRVDEDVAARMEALTPAILASIPDDAVEQAVLAYVQSRIGDDAARAPDIVAKLPVGARALYVTWWVEAEVEHGGFEQYYANTSSRLADQAAEAFEFFSAHEHAALMREASSIRALDEERRRLTRERGEPGPYVQSQLSPLDRRFLSLQENVSALRIAKIRSMPEFFSGT